MIKDYGPWSNITSASTRGNLHAAHSLFLVLQKVPDFGLLRAYLVDVPYDVIYSGRYKYLRIFRLYALAFLPSFALKYAGMILPKKSNFKDIVQFEDFKS